MNYTTVEAEIDHGHVTVKEPDKLPERGRGLLIVLPPAADESGQSKRGRIKFPIIQGDGSRLINPTRRNWMPASGISCGGTRPEGPAVNNPDRQVRVWDRANPIEARRADTRIEKTPPRKCRPIGP